MLTESLNIYVIDKDGNKVSFPNVEGMQPAIVDVNLNRERMAGAPTNTSTLMYPVCLDSYWTKKEFIEIGSERFYVKQVPTSEKNTEDTRYKHEITFVSERDILENVFFFDCVTQDTSSQISDKPRSNTTEFSFYGDLNELVQRLNDSLSYSKIYDPKGENGFFIVIDDDVEIGEAKEVSMTDAYFATAMQEIYNVFEVPYYWVGKICHVGYQENEITEPFEYGSGNGLISVQKTNAEFRLINRITGQGSADNIPYYYPNSDPNGIVDFHCDNVKNPNTVEVVVSKIASWSKGGYIGKTFTLSKSPSTKDFEFDVNEPTPHWTNTIYSPVNTPYHACKGYISYYWYMELKRGMRITTENAKATVASRDENFAKIQQTAKTYSCFVTRINKDGSSIEGVDEETVPISKDIEIDGYYKVCFRVYYDIWQIKETTAGTNPQSFLNITRSGNIIVTYNDDCAYKISNGNEIISYNKSGISLTDLESQPCDKSDISVVTYQYYGKWYAFQINVTEKVDNPASVTIDNVRYINIMSKLMPSVYRQTEGAERFYNAKNETYLDDNGEYYSFNNPYVPSEPLEGKQDFEDIKPTINGITNENGELFGEIAAVAFDDTDSDDLSVEDASDPNTNTATPVHPYFYVKLHKFSGENGFNLFKQGLAQGAMTFNFITGSCAGCSFKVQVSKGKQVDNHYEFQNHVQVDEQGNIVAGDSGDKIKASNPIASQQDTMTNSVWIALEKDNSTFGVLMPNATNNYRPQGKTELREGDKFVITNILLPTQYITAAEKRLDAALVKYMSENNDEKFTFSIKFSRIYLQEHPEIAEKINENTKLHIKYNNVDYPLFVSSYSRKSDDNILDEISVELSEKLTIAQNKSKEQMDSIMGNVNEQINSAIQNNNNNTSQGVSANDINSLKALLSNKLSRVTNDTAAGIITFLKGLVSEGIISAKQGVEIGEFISGYTGKGGRIDANGHGELESLTLRSFLAVPMLRYNRISVTDGESWNTNGFGVIEEVDTENKTITLHLEDDEYASVEQGDICRGIFQDLDSEYSTADADADDCGFATKKGFFTSYFTVVRLISSGKGECRFEYALRNESTPQPCRMMKFAQYGSFTNEQRMSSCYSSAIVHFYSQVMEHVNTWEISPMMVSLRFGWLEGFPVTLKNGNVVRLKDHGLYVPGNVYFGQTITQLDAATIADLKKQLEQYTIEVATAVDVITVDDAGNVIGGLYSLDAEGKKTDYRLSSAVFVKRGNEYLTEADKGADASSGTYRIYAYCDGCECVIDNSTIYITSIKNIKDGIAGTEDDFTFDYDAMRKMTELTVTVVADCEGIGSISKDYHVTVKHDPKPFINFVMDNQIANISYNTKMQKYVGSPYNIRVSAYKDNAKLPIVAMNGDTEVRIMSVKVSSHEGLSGWGVGYSWDEENNDVVLDVNVSNSNAASAKIMFTCSYNYAGVSYEQNIVHSVNIASDTNTYELMPSVSQVVAKTNQSGELVADTDKITCKVICNSSDDGQYVMTADELTTRKMSVKYSVGDDATLSEFPADGLSVSAEWSKIVFHLFFGDVEIDTQDVPVMLNGVDGSGVEYVFLLTTEDKEPTIYDDSDTEAFQAPDYCPYTDEAHTRQWTDEPTGVGINNRYEWVAQRKRQYGKWLQFSKATKWATHSIDGTSPYSLDLTNESSQVLCDQSGNVIGGYETTAIQLFHGASVMSVSDFNITITATNISYTLSGAVITPSAFASGKDSAQIAVKAELKTNTSVVLTAVYSITKNKAGKDGVIYSLQPSVSTFSKDSNGVWVTKSFYLYAKKTTGAGATEITTLAALEAEGLTLKYGSTTVTSSTLELVPSAICGNNAYADLYLYKGSVVIDRERINVVSDGEKGEDGEGVEYIYKLTTGNVQPAVPATPDPIDTDVKGEWTDNPQGVSAEYPYEWVSEHTKSNGTWGEYKPASIWAKWSKDGSDGKNGKYSKVFYRWSMSKPDAPTLPVTVSRTPPAPWSETFERESLVFLKSSKDAWADEGTYRYSPEGLGNSVSTIDQIEFATTNDNQVVFIELHVSSELNCDFACISGLDDEDFSKDSTKNTVKISGENMVMTEVIVPKAGAHFIRVGYFKDGTLAKGLDRCWYRIINNDNNIICWACTAMLDGETDNILSWSEVVKFVYDTNKQESIYLLSDSLTAPATPKTDKYADDYIPSVTDVKWSETVTYNVNDMVLYNGRVYICKLTSKGNYPTNTEYWKQIHNWTDDPSSVTDEFPYEYISIRKKTDGVWGSYSKPVIWTKWAMDAEAVKGDPGYSLNPPVFYEAGKKYVFERLAGTDIVVRDVVIYPVGGKYYYYMVKNRTDNSEEKVTSVPGETGNNDWQQGSKYELLIADALLAANANIGGFRIYDKKLVSVDDGANPAEDKANLVLNGVKGTIKAKKAEIEGKIIATEGSFDNCTINETCEVRGNLKGVTGTFKRLTAIDESGNEAASLTFGERGLTFDGHIRQNGVTPEGYGLRFYSADIWCRGSFGACQLNTVLVEGDIAYYYYNGFENSNRYEHSLDSFSRNGHTCYDLPLFSPGKENDATGFPVDMVLFRNSDSARYYMFTEVYAGKMVHCINIADKYNNTFILGNSGYTQCLGGVAQTWFYAGGKNINPENTNYGGGWLIMAQYDNNW